jgi:TRAP-type C4-dicarboxylate transport system permease small subunit
MLSKLLMFVAAIVLVVILIALVCGVLYHGYQLATGAVGFDWSDALLIVLVSCCIFGPSGRGFNRAQVGVLSRSREVH